MSWPDQVSRRLFEALGWNRCTTTTANQVKWRVTLIGDTITMVKQTAVLTQG
jgi:hypothetical protein